MPAPSAAPVRPTAAPDLTTTKVLAGAGAAATSAVLGSYLGATGTVTGAAIGSVVSTVGASVYQRYLDRTRDTVRAHVRLSGGRRVPVAGDMQVPAPRSADDAEAAAAQVVVTSVAAARPAPAPARRRHGWPLVAVAAVLAFGLALLAVTGVEWVAGSSLSGTDRGTSVGQVLDDGPSTTDTDEPSTERAPADEDGRTEEPSGSAEPTGNPDRGRPGGPTSTPPSTGRTAPSPTPTTTPSGPDLDILR